MSAITTSINIQSLNIPQDPKVIVKIELSLQYVFNAVDANVSVVFKEANGVIVKKLIKFISLLMYIPPGSKIR